VVLLQANGISQEIGISHNHHISTSSRDSSSPGSVLSQSRQKPDKAVKRQVDILTYRLGELKEMVQKIREAQALAERRPLPAAFVTFK
jgi:hypothetical protein